ncbi:unnamed protein product [Notodromas monacha]|uniref:TLDc domain-containing protein n=1 Tax=Notodromas monacha TaxID=399045 RepID=A0A7R9BJL4_9CRUS|nr:unnamed protein product [Notodromas monacha]CAG0916703.1 unnamed protein product [Notodromas monacha]
MGNTQTTGVGPMSGNQADAGAVKKVQTPPFLPKFAKATVFPNTEILGEKIFTYLLQVTRGTSFTNLPEQNFISAVDNLMQPTTNYDVIYFYCMLFARDRVKLIMFANDFQKLMELCYEVTVGVGKSMDDSEESVLQAFTDSVFGQKTELNIGALSKWISRSCPRIFQSLTRHIIDRVCTSYSSNSAVHDAVPSSGKSKRWLKCCRSKRKSRSRASKMKSVQNSSPAETPMCKNPDGSIGLYAGFDFRIPTCFTSTADMKKVISAMDVWLVSSALPDIYLCSAHTVVRHRNPKHKGTYNFFAEQLIALKIPKQWHVLYNSIEHGTAMNRFLFHVMRYRGPTVLLIICETDRLCIAVDEEWRDGPIFWGRDESLVLSLTPTYGLVCSGKKIVCFNTKTRGIPLGLTLGPDPRTPMVRVDKTWTTMEKNKIPSTIRRVVVFGTASIDVLEGQRKLQLAQERFAENRRKVESRNRQDEYDVDRVIMEME